ncbi:MAG TPA: hypothetical protein PKA05_08865 [Roseiflexaceae bacterium]|nr:hypothetical protein [Roseiflexaceae bacterium]HMP40477.1 hypothetical protein [Roseiflexaceae bacterium]
MCGGVRFTYQPELDAQLAQFYTPEQLAVAHARGVVESVFWQARPMLPVLRDGALQLVAWGNRERDLKLPQTGWIRDDSLLAGKWDHLRPHEVIIPVFQGVEKKIWFDIDVGIRGFLVRRGSIERVYMLTETASPAFRALTGHDRMPALIDQTAIHPTLVH